jgi:flagellar hook-associated protein 3 FlgL
LGISPEPRGLRSGETPKPQKAMSVLPPQLARVSNLLRTSVANQQITRTQEQLLKVQNELASGKRLSVPSDDPGDAAIVQQLRKTLEQRQAYETNLKQGIGHLSEVDSTFGDITDLLQEAQNIASATVGSDVSNEARQNAAEVVKSIYNQMLQLANKQFQGVYLFGGDKATDAPFTEAGGGIKFVGSNQVLTNSYDENAILAFMVDGDEAFGALSSRIEGTSDLTPAISAATRLVDLKGGGLAGVRSGSIRISDGTTSAIVDLSSADTLGDVVDLINDAGVGSITASIPAGSTGLRLTPGVGDDITVDEVGGGSTASDLGLLLTTGAGPGVTLNGSSLRPVVTVFTPLANLNGGAGIDTAGLRITNGLLSADVDLTGATTVEDMLNAINGSGTAVRAEINAAGDGINILNPTQGTQMTISELGGTTAADLGVRSFGPDSPLAELNLGKGVRTVAGNDISITDSDGVTFEVDLSNLLTTQDILDAINTAATTATAGVTASFSTTGNGIVLTDTAAGLGTLTLTPINFSEAANDLGIKQVAAGNVITGTDVNEVRAQGVFSNLAKLRDALLSSDQRAITESAEGLTEDYSRIVRMRGTAGARVQEMEARQERLAEQNLATKSVLSELEDTNFTEAVSRFQTLQTALQANLMTSSAMLNMSLIDFLD